MPGIEPSDSELEAAMLALIAGAESEDTTTLIGYVPPKGSPCANTRISNGSGGIKVNCGNEAGLSCGGCQLVRYCSKGCQVSHWPVHKSDCQSDLAKDSWQPAWVRERRSPAFVGDGPEHQAFGHLTYLWGNISAIDVLNLGKNEGEMYGGDLALLFAASGDPRNLMSTVNGLADTYGGTMTCVLNDKYINVVARNIVMLLIAAQLPPTEAAEVILHVWYSARLTKGMLTVIEDYVRKLVADVVFKIEDKSDKVLQSKKWTFGSAEITVRLTKSQWKTLLAIIDAKPDLSKTEEERRRVVLAPHRLDCRERELLTLPGFGRLCSAKFRETGVLAPMAWSLERFDCPNPLLFNEHDSTWLQMDSADPRNGWPMPSTLSTLHSDRNPKNDVNGLLYFHIRSVIERFCHRLQNPVSKVRLILYCVDAASLPGCLGTETRASGFDRIEVSNIADEAYLGLARTLGTFTTLLKSHSVNPRATLITLFLNACEIADRQMGNRSDSKVQSSQMKQALKYLPFSPRNAGTANSTEVMKMMIANDLVRDYDRIFAFYMDVVRFEDTSKQAGVKMRQRNSIVEAWPMRLKKKPGEKGADEEFQSLMASSLTGAERYVEWVREA